MQDIVTKYTIHFRERASAQSEEDKYTPLNDYAHPSKIYSTLLSLCIVLEL